MEQTNIFFSLSGRFQLFDQPCKFKHKNLSPITTCTSTCLLGRTLGNNRQPMSCYSTWHFPFFETSNRVSGQVFPLGLRPLLYVT